MNWTCGGVEILYKFIIVHMSFNSLVSKIDLEKIKLRLHFHH